MNLIETGDISQLSFVKYCELCKHISRGRSKCGKGPRYSRIFRVTKSTIGRVSRVELGYLLEIFTTYILVTLSDQLDTLKIHNK